jgi:hypothetical protein
MENYRSSPSSFKCKQYRETYETSLGKVEESNKTFISKLFIRVEIAECLLYNQKVEEAMLFIYLLK